MGGALLNVDAAVRRGGLSNCSTCARKGATLRCYKLSRALPFHFPCGVKSSCRFYRVLKFDEDPHWYHAELDGRTGYVPSNYIKMRDNKWFMNNVTRSQAEVILKRQTKDGAFLVRDSETSPDFSLSVNVKFQDSVQHFKVLRDPQGKYFLWVIKFNSLNELVDYHRTASVSRNSTILLTDMDYLKVQAMFDFAPEEAEELAFKKGDIIFVTDKSDENWWEGTHEATGAKGMFPATFVFPYSS